MSCKMQSYFDQSYFYLVLNRSPISTSPIWFSPKSPPIHSGEAWNFYLDPPQLSMVPAPHLQTMPLVDYAKSDMHRDTVRRMTLQTPSSRLGQLRRCVGTNCVEALKIASNYFLGVWLTTNWISSWRLHSFKSLKMGGRRPVTFSTRSLITLISRGRLCKQLSLSPRPYKKNS